MTQAMLNESRIATAAGQIQVFNFDGVTREYLSSTVEYLAVGVGIPASSCTDTPGKAKAGYTLCRTADFSGWEYIVDHRGEVVYSTETGGRVNIDLPGDYPANTTSLAPATPYDKWDGHQWVTAPDIDRPVGPA